MSRLLLVTNDRRVTELICRLVLDYRHEITLVSNGQQGLRSAATGSYDMMIVDGESPVVDGSTMAFVLREESGLLALPILGLADDEDDVNSMLCAGMDRVVTKPLKAGFLAQVIDQVVEHEQHLVLAVQSTPGFRVTMF
jgi:DNA-binding response OmpR family regulator